MANICASPSCVRSCCRKYVIRERARRDSLHALTVAILPPWQVGFVAAYTVFIVSDVETFSPVWPSGGRQ